MIPLLLLAVSLRTNFEAGSLGKVELISSTHLRCAVKGEVDQKGRNRQASWYYFRLDDAAGREITLDLVDLVGEYNYSSVDLSVRETTRPAFSYDNKTWQFFSDREVQWDNQTTSLRLRFRPLKNHMWIAHVPPYTTHDLARLMAAAGTSPYLHKEVVGKTVEGRDMLLLTVTNPSVSDANKKVLWLMARQHAWEASTSWVAEGTLHFLLSSDPRAGRIRDEAVFKIFPMADPDGVARGGVRYNDHGYDLNRNWDAADPKLMPEIAAQRKAMLDWVDAGRRIDLFLSMHNSNEEYLEGPLSADSPQIQQLFKRFFDLLVANTSFNPDRPPHDAGFSTTLGMPGRMTVNQGLFYARKIPAMLMEQTVDFDSKLGRVPTTEDRLAFGAGLVRCMWAAVTDAHP
jgi:hypothetical protein